MELSLRQILSRLIAEETVCLSFFGKPEYESARVSILRKFAANRKLFVEMGVDDPYAGKFIQCRFNPGDGIGTFKMEVDNRKTNIPGRIYNSVDPKTL